MSLRWTEEEYANWLATQTSRPRSLSPAEPSVRHGGEAEIPSQEAPQGVSPSSACYTISVTGYRRRVCDPDNLCPKWYIDEIVGAGYLPDDSCKYVKSIEKRVVLIKAPEPERTEIEIYYDES